MDLKLIIFALAAAALVANTVGSKEKLPQYTLQSGKVAQYQVLEPDRRFNVKEWMNLSLDEQVELAHFLARGCIAYPEKTSQPSMFSFLQSTDFNRFTAWMFDPDRIVVRKCLTKKERSLHRPVAVLA